MGFISAGFVFAFSAATVVFAGSAAPPPATEKHVVVDDYFGKKVEDPYRWLEGGALEQDEAKKQELEGPVGAWTDAQNAYTRSLLDNLPGREAVTERIAQLITVDSIGTPSMYGRRYFHSERKGDQNQAVIYIREGVEGKDRALLDPNTLDASGLVSIDWTAPSEDGGLVAFGLSRAGNEMPVLYVIDVNTGTWLAEEIPNDAGGVSWMPDASGFFYQVRRDPEIAYSTQIKYHKLGTHHRQDPILIEQHSTTWGPYAYLSRDGRWLIVGDWTGTDSNDLYVVDADHWRRSGEFVQTPIVVGEKAVFSGSVYGDTLYMDTTLGSPNKSVYAVDLNHPEQANWKMVIQERPDAVIEGVSTARGLLVVNYLYKAHTQIKVLDLDGKMVRELALPGIGSAGVSTSDDRTEAFLSYASFNDPNSIYHIDLKDGSSQLWARPEVPVDPSIVEVKQVTYNSKDGTAITMFVVHKKGIKLDGNNPTILNGYGGFDISMTPRFSRTLFPWFEAGGVYALPNLRGGGEYGENWHRAGMLENKQNVFDDFVAAAEWLIANKYTSPNRLAISGGSNGGLLVGAVAVQRPDLFRVAACGVPLLDMLRYQHFLMARYWVPEYGDATTDSTQFEFLRAYSPYQNVKSGVKYPAVFFTAGENDARVHAMHARKMAAAMQAATGSSPDERPILLWVDREAGHGSGKPIKNIIRDVVDERIFVMWQLGMLEKHN